MTPSGCPVTPGFPIRRSPDHSSFDSSPRHFAACHVLHRLSTPRHPPCALSSLATFMRGCRPATTRFLARSRTSASCPGQTDFQRLRLPFDSPTSIKKIAPPNRLEYCDSFPQINRSADHCCETGKTKFRGSRQICVRLFNCQRSFPPTHDPGSLQSTGAPQCIRILHAVKRSNQVFCAERPIRLNTAPAERNLRG